MKNSLKKFTTLLASVLTVASAGLSSHSQVFAEEEVAGFQQTVEHEGEPIEGGIVKYAVAGGKFAGVFNSMFYTLGTDGTIIGFFNPGLYGYNSNFEITNDGFGDIEFDIDNKQITVKIPEGTKWDDGEPLTIDDVIFPYYVLADPDYKGSRRDNKVTNVVGYDEYNEGKADEISGLERVDDYTLRITYKEVTPNFTQANGMLLGYVEPKHILEDIPVSEMEESDPVRKNPVGFGPFKLTSIIPGEAVSFVANENYYKGRPKVDGLELEVINPDLIVQELKAGNYDISGLPANQYDAWSELENITVLGSVNNSYDMLGFRFGHYDHDKGVVVMEEDRITHHKALRQAMAYAIDNDAVASEFYNGLRMRAKSFITPNFTNLVDDRFDGYPYNPEKAKEILAEAGFVDNDGDGFVEDPDGEPFEVTFAASTSGSEISEAVTQYYLDCWKQVGINVKLYQGRLMDFNAMCEAIDNDEEEIDMFQMSLTVGGDPNPGRFWDKTSHYWNMYRYTTDELDELLDGINKAFTDEEKKEAYYNWNSYMLEELPSIPLLNSIGTTAVNKRVKNYTVDADNTEIDWSNIQLTAEEPIAD